MSDLEAGPYVESILFCRPPMPDFAQHAIDHLEQLRKPLVKRSLVLIVSVCLLLVGLHVWSLLASRLAEIVNTGTSTANMARALASHAERTIDLGDAILDEMVTRAESGETGTPGAALHARLVHIASVTPQIQELFVYGDDGKRLATSLSARLPGSVADREYFRYHQMHADRGTRIGKPIYSRSSGVLGIPLTRRIDRPDGSFGGVAMASLKLSFFGDFYDSFDVGESGTLILAIDDGTLLYRRPFRQDMVGTNIGGGPVFQLYRASGPVGTAMLTSKIDRIERLYSYRHVDRFPLLVAIAKSKEEVLGEWWVAVVKMSCVVLCAVALLAWGTHRMVGQLQVRDALEGELRGARLKLKEQNLALKALADSDGLTGLANRHSFEHTLVAEYERARRNGQPWALIMTDVDHFKKYNDRYGHVAGDECLRLVAGALRSGTRRPTDLAARYGGEEFALILPDTDLEGARAVADNIRAAVAALDIAHADGLHGRVTLSIGVVAAQPAGADVAALAWVEAADALLYQAKAQGRDRIIARALRRPAEPLSA